MSKTNNFQLIDFVIGVGGGEAEGGKDIRINLNQILYLRYTEDIRQASVRCEVMITDSQSGVCSLLEGMEPVFIGFQDEKEAWIAHHYVIYDIQDRQSKDGKSKATLMLCTPDFINNAAMKISRRFGSGEGKKIHKIIEDDILGPKGILKSTNDIFVDETENVFSFISPYWSPYTIISWLCSKSLPAIKGSGRNASAGYCFFENKDGYHFKSFDSFHTQAITRKLIVGHEPSTAEEDTEEEKNIIPIREARIVSSSDVLKGLNIGSYSSKVMTLDLHNMKYQEFPFNINKYYEDIPLLNENPPKPRYYQNFEGDTSATRIMSKITDTALFTSGTYTKGFTRQLSQAALREKLFYNKQVECEFIGSNILTVGDTVHLTTYKGKEKEEDKFNSGYYVVGKVEKQYTSSNETMVTKLLLYTDSPGTE